MSEYTKKEASKEPIWLERGTRLRTLRNSFNLNQKDFADRVGLRESSISAIETGKRTMGRRIATDIAKTFKINPLWLLSGEGEMDDFDPKMVGQDVSSKLHVEELNELYLRAEASEAARVAAINEIIDKFRESLSRKDEQIERLISLLEKNSK